MFNVFSKLGQMLDNRKSAAQPVFQKIYSKGFPKGFIENFV